jgi:uncharacterized tellurite resistance protein B-like protein|tara:strand:+ start:34 stop:2313 length:2280 start_codon:yes stop_codon:yes gene_type:complete
MALIDGKLHEDEKSYIFDCCKDDYEVDVDFIMEKINEFKELNNEELGKNFFENLKQIDDKDNREIIFSHLERLAKNDSYLHPEENDLLKKLSELWKIKRKYDFRKGQLDNKQKEIVERKHQSRTIVFSPPGCGKTHVAGNRASYLMKDLKINPSSIIMVSFTRTAVKEFRERVDQITDLNIGELKIITLDSFTFEYLHGFGDAKKTSSYLTGAYEENISKFMEMIKEKNSDVMDHLKEIKHIIIDEAQDITGIRGKLVETIIGSVDRDCGLTIFGDPNQAIYDWTDEETDKTSVRENFMNVIKKEKFEIMQLEINYRMKNERLVELSKNLRPSNNEKDSDYFKILNDNKKKLLNNSKDKQQTFEDDLKKVNKRKSNLFLFRRRAEMMRAAERALKNGFIPALRFGGSQNCIYPWIGSIFYDHTDKLISKSDFVDKWFQRCLVGRINSEMEPEEAWNKLIKTAKKKNDVDLSLLRKKLSSKPPLDLCLTDYGLSNLIFGTIHASKGREADIVHYYTEPPKEKKSNKSKTNYEEENRVLYVACTRAKEDLYVKNIKEKEILSFGDSYEVGNRTYLNVLSKNNERLIRIQVGLKDDFDDLSLVSKRILSAGEGYTQEKVLETQKFLKQESYTPFEISCFPMSASLGREERNLSYSEKYNYNMLVFEKGTEKKKYSFGSLNSRSLGATIQNILKKASGGRMYKPSAVYGIWVVGCRTAVIDENNIDLSEVHEPFSETGFWLAPIIMGWGTVFSTLKARFRKFL